MVGTGWYQDSVTDGPYSKVHTESRCISISYQVIRLSGLHMVGYGLRNGSFVAYRISAGLGSAEH